MLELRNHTHFTLIGHVCGGKKEYIKNPPGHIEQVWVNIAVMQFWLLIPPKTFYIPTHF